MPYSKYDKAKMREKLNIPVQEIVPVLTKHEGVQSRIPEEIHFTFTAATVKPDETESPEGQEDARNDHHTDVNEEKWRSESKEGDNDGDWSMFYWHF